MKTLPLKQHYQQKAIKTKLFKLKTRLSRYIIILLASKY